VSTERDWLDELISAGVLVLADFDDANGNPAYELRGFPPGEEGVRLRALFDRHVQGRADLTSTIVEVNSDGQRRE
jgi:hypothetical protein